VITLFLHLHGNVSKELGIWMVAGPLEFRHFDHALLVELVATDYGFECNTNGA
jgi:hypothetical protein